MNGKHSTLRNPSATSSSWGGGMLDIIDIAAPPSCEVMAKEVCN